VCPGCFQNVPAPALKELLGNGVPVPVSGACRPMLMVLAVTPVVSPPLGVPHEAPVAGCAPPVVVVVPVLPVVVVPPVDVVPPPTAVLPPATTPPAPVTPPAAVPVEPTAPVVPVPVVPVPVPVAAPATAPVPAGALSESVDSDLRPQAAVNAVNARPATSR